MTDSHRVTLIFLLCVNVLFNKFAIYCHSIQFWFKILIWGVKHMLSNSLKQTNRNNDINNTDFKSTYPAAQRADQYKHNRTLIVYIKAMMTLYQLSVENVNCQ